MKDIHVDFWLDDGLPQSLHWLLLIVVAALLILPVWLILRNDALSTQRKVVRLTLNALLWLVVLAYVLQPVWTVATRTTHALLIGQEVPGSYQRQLSDSLHLPEVVTARTFVPDRFDSVTLLGQVFPAELLSRLSRQVVRWIPYYAPDRVQTIRWKGLVQKGEMQRVTGAIQSSKKQRLKLMYANRTLDSLTLPEGFTAFTLQFPAFTLGRTETELVLGSTALDTLRFFVRPVKPLTYQFILDTPDFESKTLADWLGQSGNAVDVTATLSKDVSNRLTINRVSAKPDVIITDPANADNVLVKRAVADGKAVLFINLTNPEADCRLINQALGSRWQVRKVSNEPSIPVGNGLSALPYTLITTATQTPIPGYPAAVQQTAARIGVSLLSETFPLKLSGDSLAYNRVWSAILARLRPSSVNSSQIDAPVVAGFQETMYLNNVPAHPAAIRVGNDTVSVAYSAINPLSATGRWLVNRSGWLPVEDTLAVYAEPSGQSDVARSRLVQAYALAHSVEPSAPQAVSRFADVRLPDWAWLLLVIACLTALWVEPKLG